MKEEVLKKARNQMVAKHNDLARARFTLSVTEQRILLFLISKIKPKDKAIEEQEFEIRDFCEVVGLDPDGGGGRYNHLKDTLMTLRDKGFWINLDDKTIVSASWLERIWLREGDGTVTLKIDEHLKPWLLGLIDEKQYTSYELEWILCMKKAWSIRLYELLRSYKRMRTVDSFTIDDFKAQLGVEDGKYKQTNDFLKELDKAVREVNEVTDITASYTVNWKGKRKESLTFSIVYKGTLERIKTIEKNTTRLDRKAILGQQHMETPTIEEQESFLSLGLDELRKLREAQIRADELNVVEPSKPTLPAVNTYRLEFGKYKGTLLVEVAKKDTGYLDWLCTDGREEPVRSLARLLKAQQGGKP